MASSAYPHMIFATDKAELDRDRLVALLGECCPGGEAEQSSLKVTWTREGYAFTFWFEDADRVGEMYADYLPEGARRRPLVNATTVIDMSGDADPDGTHEGVARVVARHLAQQDGVSVFAEERKRFVAMAYGDETPEELAALTEPAAVAAPAPDAAPAADVAPAEEAADTGDVVYIEPPIAPEPAEVTPPAADAAAPQPVEPTQHAEEPAAPETVAPRTEGAAPQPTAAGPAQVAEPAGTTTEDSFGTEPALSGDPEPGAFGAEPVESSLTDQGDLTQVDGPQDDEPQDDEPQDDELRPAPAGEGPVLPQPHAVDGTCTPGTPPEAEPTPAPAAPVDRVPGTVAPAPIQTDTPTADTPTAEADRATESPATQPELVAPHPPAEAQPATELPGGALDEQRVAARPQDVEPAVTSVGEGAFGADLPREQTPQHAPEPLPTPEPQPEATPKQEKGFFKKLFGRR
ncbi:hypothetical protein [Arsenicicoccus dermatophilus]|uniref:hypothetical protein n=1 Tax=Arsenicicoccus dermatophilus TaxID=1076331 RepID=UPI003917628B